MVDLVSCVEWHLDGFSQSKKTLLDRVKQARESLKRAELSYKNTLAAYLGRHELFSSRASTTPLTGDVAEAFHNSSMAVKNETWERPTGRLDDDKPFLLL